MPFWPVSQLSTVQAACLFFDAFASEYETVNPRLELTLPCTMGATPNLTCGKFAGMYGSTQLPSKMIAAFSFPSASPGHPTPSWVGVAASPFLKPDVEVHRCRHSGRLHVCERALVLVDERQHPRPVGVRQIGFPSGTAPEEASFWAAAVSSAQVRGALLIPAFANIVLLISTASGDQSFGKP